MYIDLPMPRRQFTLREFLSITMESQSAFSARSGVPQSAISRLCNGGDVCGRHWARIMRASRGMVTPEIHFPASSEAA